MKLHPPLAQLTALSFMTTPIFGGVIFTDSFSGSGSPDGVWETDTNNTANATVNVGGGFLNVNSGPVTGLETARHTLELSGSGAPTIDLSSSWTIDAAVTIGSASQIPGIAAGEGVGVSLDIRNDLPSTNDRAQINVVALDFGDGNGVSHALRGAQRIDGNETANITPIGPANSALSVTIRASYDSTTSLISLGADTGSGFFQLVDPVDTSLWALTVSDPLQIQLELGLVKFSQDPATSTFSLEDGEASVDSFTIQDEALSAGVVPEPSALILTALGALGCLRRRRP